MSELRARIASDLAVNVYAVQNSEDLELFMMRSEFSASRGSSIKIHAEVGGRIVRSAVDGFGICAFGGAGYEQDIFLIFRGSTSANRGADWVSNFKIGLGFTRSGRPVHIGFLNIFKSMESQIQSFLKDHIGRIRTVHCIGHSLGGAVATLAAEWIKSSSPMLDVKLYTFGAPKPGMSIFSSGITAKLGFENIYRVYHATDPVPMIPLFPFIHPPYNNYGHYISTNESILSAQDHDVRKYRESVKDKIWEDFKRRGPAYSSESAVEEWLSSRVSVDANSSKTWQWLNEAMMYILKKVLYLGAHILQAGITSLVTLADKLAWLLIKAKDLLVGAWDGSVWLLRFMKKAMQALGIKVVSDIAELTQTVIRNVIERLIQKTLSVAKKAVQAINIH